MSYKSFEGKLRVLSEVKPWLYSVEVWLLNGLTNRNQWRYENLDKHMHCFEETPILCAFPNGKIGDGHNFRQKRDPKTGEEYATFLDSSAERIVGWFAPGSIRMENKDGVDWIVGQGNVWAYYNRELVDNLTAQGGEGMDVSIETLVSDNHIRMDGDTEVYDTYEVVGTTILGKGVTPAVAGASIRAMTEIDRKLNDIKLRVASYIEHGEDALTMKHKGVNKRMNKRLLAQIQERFKEKVIGVSEDGLNVALCDRESGELYGYTFENAGDAVDESKYQAICLNCSAEFANGYEMPQDFGEITSIQQERINELCVKEKLLEEAQKTITLMQQKEMARRKKACKEAIRRELGEINADMPEKVDDKICEEIDKAIENGDFENCENEQGEWIGEEKACAMLKAMCMDKVKEFNRKSSAAKERAYIWDTHHVNEGKKSNATSILEEMGIR